MSAGCPKRLKTVRDLNRSYIGLLAAAALPASDSMMLGAIALAVMLCRPPSSAAVLARPMSPALVAEELAWPKPPSVPATEDMKIGRPTLFATRYGHLSPVRLKARGRLSL